MIADEVFNFKKIFLLTLAATYNSLLLPPVDDGVEASTAVLVFLANPKVFAKLMKLVKTRFFRLSNRKLLCSCASELNDFVREGGEVTDRRDRLSLLRSLQDDGYITY